MWRRACLHMGVFLIWTSIALMFVFVVQNQTVW